VNARAETGRPQPIAQAADFERVLRTRSRGQTQHFAVHHLPDCPSLSARARRAAERAAVARRLSTGGAPESDSPVDDSAPTAPEPPALALVGPDRLWFGSVVPKRHARRAVTRSLLKRQMRCALERHAATLAPGLWVLRLRAPFDKAQFPSAASDRLKSAARAELDALFGTAAR
jgi:ribonuclease P protein component